MSKIVKLNSAEHRAWNHNTPQLVDRKGTPIRPLRPDEEKACFQVSKLAQRSGKSVEKIMRFNAPDEDGVPHHKELTIEARVKRLGTGTRQYEVYMFIEGLLRVSSRDIITARVFKKHGVCQIQRPNGKFLKMARDPSKVVKTTRGIPGAPIPENCVCAMWGGRQTGRHSLACPYNLKAPEEQRAIPVGKQEVPASLPPGIRPAAAKNTPKVKPKKIVPIDPKDCECNDWRKRVGEEDKHHRMCKLGPAWENQLQNRPTFYLVRISDGVRIREASLQEVGEAETCEQKMGSRMIQINEVPYAVLKAEEIPEQPGGAVDDDDIVEEVTANDEEFNSSVDSSDKEFLSTIAQPGDDVQTASEARAEEDAPHVEKDSLGTGLDSNNDAGGLVGLAGLGTEVVEEGERVPPPPAVTMDTSQDDEGLALPGLEP